MIRFGSRTEVYLPLAADRAGESGRSRARRIDNHCATARSMSEQNHLKIYLLPNLMTAGNLFCGFTATLKILEGALLQSSNPDAAGDLFHTAIWFVLAALFLICSMVASHASVDMRVRLVASSILLADIVSFGVAPALMVYRVVLQEFPRACWIIAFIYLACGALRLARFNTAAANARTDDTDNKKTFTGFPIPAAAGLIASITLFLLWLAEGEHHLGNWKFVLPPLIAFSFLHDVQPVSNIRALRRLIGRRRNRSRVFLSSVSSSSSPS